MLSTILYHTYLPMMMVPTACTEMVLPDPWLLENVEELPHTDKREGGDGKSKKTTPDSRSLYNYNHYYHF